MCRQQQGLWGQRDCQQSCLLELSVLPQQDQEALEEAPGIFATMLEVQMAPSPGFAA